VEKVDLDFRRAGPDSLLYRLLVLVKEKEGRILVLCASRRCLADSCINLPEQGILDSLGLVSAR